MALGLPGLLLIVIGVLSILNWAGYSWIAFLIVFGTYLVVKGFMLDKAARNFYVWVQEYSPPPFPKLITGFAAVTGFLLIGIGAYQGFYQASAFASGMPPPQLVGALPTLFGHFLSQSIFLVVVGISTVLFGRAIHWFFEHDSRLLRTVDIMVVVIWSSHIFYETSQILIDPMRSYDTLVFSIIVGIVLAVASVLFTSLLHRQYAGFFREKGRKVEEG